MSIEDILFELRTYINENHPGLVPNDDELEGQSMSLSQWLHENTDAHTGRDNALMEALRGLEDATWMED